jgi:hypothetical protein
VKSNVSVKNARIRLFDEADKVMVSDDEQLAPPERPTWEYQIQLPLALKTGHRYTLVIDAQQGDSFSDEFNRPLLEKRVELKVAGEKEKPPPPEKPKRKRRRH